MRCLSRLSPLALLPFLSFLLNVQAQDSSDYGHFIQPPAAGPYGDMSSNPVYSIGQKIQVSWDMVFDAADVYMWQPAKSQSLYQLLQDDSLEGFNWTVSAYNFNLNGVNKTSGIAMNTFYFFLYESGGTAGFTCHYFNISIPSSTTSGPTATATLNPTKGASSISVSPTRQALAPTSSSSPEPVSNGGLSTGAKAGLGVGIGVGVPLIAAAAAGLGYWLRKRRGGVYKPVNIVNQDATGAGGGPGSGPGGPMAGAAGGYYGQKQADIYGAPTMKDAGNATLAGPQEMAANNPHRISELDSSSPAPAQAPAPVEMPGSEFHR